MVTQDSFPLYSKFLKPYFVRKNYFKFQIQVSMRNYPTFLIFRFQKRSNKLTLQVNNLVNFQQVPYTSHITISRHFYGILFCKIYFSTENPLGFFQISLFVFAIISMDVSSILKSLPQETKYQLYVTILQILIIKK